MNESTKLLAKIAKNKSLLKEYVIDNVRTVYLNDNDEFQLQIFNPYTYTLGCLIKIDGVSLSNKLIIRPGERIWVERYFDKNRKFCFKTYTVENTEEVTEAISNNGNIEFLFYKEKSRREGYIINSTSILDGIYEWDSDMFMLYSTRDAAPAKSAISAVINSNALTNNANATCTSTPTFTSYTYSSTTPETIETGRVGEGGYSSQKFDTVNINLEPFAFKTEVIKILPTSRKTVNKNDLQKVYCTNCGRKLKSQFNFCPYCGNENE